MVFGDLFGKAQRATLFLGSPEAEAEATANSRVSLVEVYEDYHNLLPALSSEKFILVGRKGSGKSAFVEYVFARSKGMPNTFCHLIRASDCDIERAIQTGREAGAPLDTEAFIRWLIYTNILRLFAENAAVQEDEEFELLRQFLRKNSGYIDIRDFDVKSLVETNGFNVSIEYLKRFFKAKFDKVIEIKSEKAPYFKLLPHLEETLVKVLRSSIELDNHNSYALFFDDLDVWCSVLKPASLDSLMCLIRACRHVNNEVFGKNGINAKAIILLRDDVEAYLSARYADTAKIFSSYSCKINWYQDEYAGNDEKENGLNLKKFINRRIEYACKKSGMSCDSNDPWSSLVNRDVSSTKTSFKYIVNQTLFRPRDLLLFFKPLENGNFSYPLSRSEVNNLINMYSDELAKEIKNELSSFYSDIQVANIFQALARMANGHTPYGVAHNTISDNCNDVNASEVLEFLFDRSIIGTCDNNNWYWFKCREPVSPTTILGLDKTHNIVVQYGIRQHLIRRYADQRI